MKGYHDVICLATEPCDISPHIPDVSGCGACPVGSGEKIVGQCEGIGKEADLLSLYRHHSRAAGFGEASPGSGKGNLRSRQMTHCIFEPCCTEIEHVIVGEGNRGYAGTLEGRCDRRVGAETELFPDIFRATTCQGCFEVGDGQVSASENSGCGGKGIIKALPEELSGPMPAQHDISHGGNSDLFGGR